MSLNQSIKIVNHNNDDLLVVNAARESLAKEKSSLSEADIRLLHFLAKNHHITPFFHPKVSLMYKTTHGQMIKRLMMMESCQSRFTMLQWNPYDISVLETSSLLALHQFPLRPNSGKFSILDEKFPESSKALKEHVKAYEPIKVKYYTEKDPMQVDLQELPLKHLTVTIRVDTSIAVARQWFRSTVGFARNERSRRYIDSDPEFMCSPNRMKHPEGNKYGSSNLLAEVEGPTKEQFCGSALDMYRLLIQSGVAAECARDVLPVCTKTSWIETGDLMSYARLFSLRSGDGAQEEIVDLAKKLDEVLTQKFGKVWEDAKAMFDKGVFCGRKRD